MEVTRSFRGTNMLTITLPPELEEVVTREARKRGTTPDRLVIEVLRNAFLPAEAANESELQGTLADYLSDYIGSVNSRENGGEVSNLSEDTGKKFTQLMVEKHRQGKL
jgi:hypothetical protein